MSGGGLVGFTGLEQALAAVLPQGLEHVVARFRPRLGLPPDQALVEERRHEVQGIRAELVGRQRDRVGGLQRPPAAKHREAAEGGPLGRRQQAVAPRHRGMQRPVALRDVASGVREQLEAVFEPAEDRGGRQRLGAGGRQLEGQREAVQAPADPRDVGEGPLVRIEAGRHGARALEEELDRFGGRRGRVVRVGRDVQRRHDELVLPGQAQRGAARDEDAKPGSGRQPRCHRGGTVDHVLEVVEHQQQLPIGEVAADGVPHRGVGLLVDGQHLGDGLRDQVVVLDRGQRRRTRHRRRTSPGRCAPPRWPAASSRCPVAPSS